MEMKVRAVIPNATTPEEDPTDLGAPFGVFGAFDPVLEVAVDEDELVAVLTG